MARAICFDDFRTSLGLEYPSTWREQPFLQQGVPLLQSVGYLKAGRTLQNSGRAQGLATKAHAQENNELAM